MLRIQQGEGRKRRLFAPRKKKAAQPKRKEPIPDDDDGDSQPRKRVDDGFSVGDLDPQKQQERENEILSKKTVDPPGQIETDISKREKIFEKLLHKLYYEDKIMRGRDVLFYEIKRHYPQYNNQGLSRRFIAQWLTKQEVHGVFTAGPAMAYQRTIQRIVTKAPFTRMAMDLVDMGTKASDGMKWLLNVIDTFSKYAWSKAIPDKEGQTVTEYLGDILADMQEEFGAQPRMIQSDNGSEFVSKEMKAFLKEKGIRQVFSLPHKPQSNGAIERFNGTIERMLNQIRFQEGDTHWPRYLDKVVETYNTSYQDAIKKAPREVVMSFISRGESDETFDRLEKARKNMNPSLSKADAKRFNVGDKVRIRLNLDKRSGRNWSRNYFTIVQRYMSKYGPQYYRTMYKLQAQNGEPLENRYQNDQLLKYVEPTTKMSDDVPQSIVSRLERPTAVKYNMPDGTQRNRAGYLVKFVGETGYENVEREILMEDVPKIVEKFENEHKVKWTGVDGNNPKFTWEH